MPKRESPAAALARMRWAKDAVRDQPREAGKHGGRPGIPTPCPACGEYQTSKKAARKHCAAEKRGHVCEEER